MFRRGMPINPRIIGTVLVTTFLVALGFAFVSHAGLPGRHYTYASAAFAVATSFATCASLRGDRDAWVAWATGLPLAAVTGYLRIAADRHYLSDVLAGAGAGTLFGILVPRLLHSPGSLATPQQRELARLPALTFGGRF